MGIGIPCRLAIAVDPHKHAPARYDMIIRILPLLVIGSLLSVAASAAQPEFPIRGPFGDPKANGCKAAFAQEEGEYVYFNKGGSTGEGGEGGCDYTRIEKIGADRYLMTGTCTPLDAKPEKARQILVVLNKDEVIYRETRYVRCK